MKSILLVANSIERYLSLLLLIGTLLFAISRTQAQIQGIPSDGKDFYVGSVLPSYEKNQATSGRDFHGYFGQYVLISSYEGDNQVTISYFDGSGTEILGQKNIISSRNSVQIALDRTEMRMTEPGDIPEFHACHITAKKPISVQFFSTGANSGGSYLALPTPGLGKKYVIASYNDNPGIGAFDSLRSGEKAGGYFMVIAPFDHTHVTITPNGLTAGGHLGMHTGAGATGVPHPYTVELRRGQCYWVKGDGSNSSNDLSGSTVTSDKPIAVLVGHEDAFLGSTGNGSMESRNFMIQQLIPAEDFDSTGYLAMPLLDAPGTNSSDPGFGENLRIFAFDSNSVAVRAKEAGSANSISLPVTALQSPPKELHNVAVPTEFYSTDSRKFSVMLYDLRDQGGSNPPHPAECMMSIVPLSHWRTSFLLFVPANTFDILQNYYINVLAERNDIDSGYIKYSLNGSSVMNAISNFKNITKVNNFPDHPEIEGARIALSPGAYYFTNTRTATDPLIPIDTMLHGAFMVYHYGMRAIDPDHDLGDLDSDDFFFAYANPLGMTLGSGGGKPVAVVDTLCASWRICLSDTGGITIRSATLLDDPGGNFDKPGRQYHNAQFDPALDPFDTKELEFSGDNSTECFDVLVSNPFDSAYVPLYIVDSRGQHSVIELRWMPPALRLSKLPELPGRLDTLSFPLINVGQEICSTLVYINSAQKGGRAFNITGVNLKGNNTHFSISNVNPSVPLSLQPGDTLKVKVCFDPKDTSLAVDSLVLRTDCFTASLPVVGSGGTGIIYASDIDFGDVPIGMKVCLPMTVENRGKLPFILTRSWLLHDTSVFSMDPASAAKLPDTLQPRQLDTIIFCYSPKSLTRGDSTSIDWNTDIHEPYTNQLKSWSYLRGNHDGPPKPGVIWDRKQSVFFVDSLKGIDSVIHRVDLVNASNSRVHIDSVYFIGSTAYEFYMLGNQLGRTDLRNFDLNINDSIWIDLVFKPDLEKPFPEKYADRLDTLAAAYHLPSQQSDSSIYLSLIGTWSKSNVRTESNVFGFTLNPNPLVNRGSLMISFTLSSGCRVLFGLYDELGREVYRDPLLSGREFDAGLHESKMQLPDLESGTYYGRVTAGNRISTQKIEILR
ncbi:MAG: T9SS type A sorting domain-containing protein [Bacteroidota bacterium]|nr:T9SS type A sorting domain-containing protein [Bacteroidota bacterium]